MGEDSEVDKDMIGAGDDNTDAIPLDTPSDADCKEEPSSVIESSCLPLLSDVFNFVGIDLRLWIPLEDRVPIVCTLFNEGSMASELFGRMEILAVVVLVVVDWRIEVVRFAGVSFEVEVALK